MKAEDIRRQLDRARSYTSVAGPGCECGTCAFVALGDLVARVYDVGIAGHQEAWEELCKAVGK